MSYSTQEAAALLDKGRGQKDQILIIMREAWRRARWWHRECLTPWEGDIPPPLDERALQTAEMLSLESASSGDAIDWYDRDPPFEKVWFTLDELTRWQRVMSGVGEVVSQYFNAEDPGKVKTESPVVETPGDKLGRRGEAWTDEEILAVLKVQARVGTAKTAEQLGCSDSLVRGLKKRAMDKGLISPVSPNGSPNVFDALRLKPPSVAR